MESGDVGSPNSRATDAWVEAEFAALVRDNPWLTTPLEPPYFLPDEAAAASPYVPSLLPGPWYGPVLTSASSS